jgi:hypothetical protein
MQNFSFRTFLIDGKRVFLYLIKHFCSVQYENVRIALNGVEEMNKQEVMHIEGSILPLLILAAVVLFRTSGCGAYKFTEQDW